MSVGLSWATGMAVNALIRKSGVKLPTWLDELAAGIAGVLFSVAAGRLIGGNRSNAANNLGIEAYSAVAGA